MPDLDWLLSHHERLNSYFYLAVPDYAHLRRLVDAWPDAAHPVRRILAAKLRRGILCGPEPLHDIVTVGAEVEFSREPREPARDRCVLVYPDEVPMPEHGLPVTQPLGAVLLGMREGQVIQQPSPDGKPFFLRVERVRQPVRRQRREAAALASMAAS